MSAPLIASAFLALSDEDIGLGDVVTRMTYAVGIRPCGGCERRAAALNSWMTFSGRRGH